jgi:hypothetical protein
MRLRLSLLLCATLSCFVSAKKTNSFTMTVTEPPPAPAPNANHFSQYIMVIECEDDVVEGEPLDTDSGPTSPFPPN